MAIILPSTTCRMACPHISLGDLVRSHINLPSHSCLLIEDHSPITYFYSMMVILRTMSSSKRNTHMMKATLGATVRIHIHIYS